MSAYLICVKTDHLPAVQSLYLLAGAALLPASVARLAADLLHDPVVQQARWHALDDADPVEHTGPILEVAYRPGVTDNEAESLLEGARRLGVSGLENVHTLRRYLLVASEGDTTQLARELAN